MFPVQRHGTIGNFFDSLGRSVDALVAHEQALQIRERLVQKHSHVPQFQAALARNHANIDNLRRTTGQSPELAIESHQQSCRIFEKLALANPSVTEFQADLARGYGNLGIALSTAPRPAQEILQSYERGREIRERLVATNPAVTQFRAELARDHNNIGNVLRATGQVPEALTHYEQAAQIYSDLRREFPDEAGSRLESSQTQNYQSDLGLTLNNQALALEDLQEFTAAEALFRQAIEHQRAAFERAPQIEQYRTVLSNHSMNFAALLRKLERPAEAAAIAMERKILWPNHGGHLYNVACELAMCIPLVGKDQPELTEAEQAQRHEYSDWAVAALRDAIRVGYKDRNQILKDKDLDPIRDQAGFRELVASIPQ